MQNITLVGLFVDILFYFFKDFIYLCLERGKEGEREGGKHRCVVASHTSPTGHLACNPGMSPDWESNQRPFGSQIGTKSTEPGLITVNFMRSVSHPLYLTECLAIKYFQRCYSHIYLH